MTGYAIFISNEPQAIINLSAMRKVRDKNLAFMVVFFELLIKIFYLEYV
jgi:hypothetical protein